MPVDSLSNSLCLDWSSSDIIKGFCSEVLEFLSFSSQGLVIREGAIKSLDEEEVLPRIEVSFPLPATSGDADPLEAPLIKLTPSTQDYFFKVWIIGPKFIGSFITCLNPVS